MGVYSEQINHDELASQQAGDIRFVNDFNTSSPDEKEALKSFLYTHYQNSERIEHAASCTCEAITDMDLLGVICPQCNTPVVSMVDRPIESSLWVRAPEGTRALISPQAWAVLENFMATRDFNFLEYLVRTDYSPGINRSFSKATKIKLKKLKEANIPRGLNNFIDHFDDIMTFVIDNKIVEKPLKVRRELNEYLALNRETFFPQVLPVISPMCLIVETTNSGIYIDDPIKSVVNSVLTIASLNSSPIKLKSTAVQNRTARALKSLATFYTTYLKERISVKLGLLRRNVFGSSLYLTMRCVITSITAPHRFDEIYTPWSASVQMLKYHILNKLKKRGMSTADGLRYIYEHVLQYDPLIDEIFQELIAESKYGGLPCTLGRNPTLQRGSIQFFFIARVKTDVSDNSISLSAGALRAPNADTTLH